MGGIRNGDRVIGSSGGEVAAAEEVLDVDDRIGTQGPMVGR
jgi:hypothetical protein